MKTRWTLVVNGLGKLEHAEVRLHPLLLFVGENNSGKSYLASLLWGLMAFRRSLFPQEVPTSEAFRRCDDWLLKKCQADPGPYILQREDYDLLMIWFNEMLHDRRDEIGARIFLDEKFKIAHLEIRDLSQEAPLTLEFQNRLRGESVEIETAANRVVFKYEHGRAPGPAERYFMLCQIIWKALMEDLAAPYNRGSSLQERILQDPIFLPASRSGFMLMYKSVVRNNILSIGGGSDVELPLPSRYFLDVLATHMKEPAGPFADEANHIEERCLHGLIERRRGPVLNEFAYRFDQARAPLAMALSSSLVTELAPVVLALRYVDRFGVLILEEPEAHLHPKYQRVLAQTLARLVHKGLCVWITTHSETFCQQINNFLKLGVHPQRASVQAELGYGEQDYLLGEQVAGYQFVNHGHASTVTELEKTEQGLVMPTFNDELFALVRETMRLEDPTGGAA